MKNKKLDIQVYWTEDFSSLKYLDEADQLEILSMDAEITALVDKLNFKISEAKLFKIKDWTAIHKLNEKIENKIEKMNIYFQFKIDRVNEAS